MTQHRTGAGARLNPDHINMQRLVVVGVVIGFLASILTSWNGLAAVAEWQGLAPAWRWLTPLMIDSPIVVLTLAGLILRKREQSTWLVTVGAYGLTAVSAIANFMHTVSIRGLDSADDWAGAFINALAPFLVLLSTEVLGSLITRPRGPSKAERVAKRASDARAKSKRRQAIA